MAEWIVGIVLVLFVSSVLWLIHEFMNAPLCDENGQCFK